MVAGGCWWWLWLFVIVSGCLWLLVVGGGWFEGVESCRLDIVVSE